MKSGIQKTEIKKLNFLLKILKIQSDENPLGLHREGEKSNMSDSEP